MIYNFEPSTVQRYLEIEEKIQKFKNLIKQQEQIVKVCDKTVHDLNDEILILESDLQRIKTVVRNGNNGLKKDRKQLDELKINPEVNEKKITSLTEDITRLIKS